MDGVGGHGAWQWYNWLFLKQIKITNMHICIHRLMLILGVITVAFGIILFFFLVDDPRSKFLRLTPEQREIVEERIRDHAVVITREIKYYQIIEDLKEPRFYCFIFSSMLINFQNGALNTFSSIITAGFGFSVILYKSWLHASKLILDYIRVLMQSCSLFLPVLYVPCIL